MNTVNTNNNILLNREENHLNIHDSYLEIEFVVSENADGMNFNYGTTNYNEPFKEIVDYNKDYKELTHKNKPHINHRIFENSYEIYLFDTSYQNDHIGPQPIQLIFKFSVAVADVICHALVLTRKVISVNSDRNKMVDVLS